MITTAREQTVRDALDDINAGLYEGNVIFNREPEQVGRRVRFTLRVRDSKGPGAKVSIRFDGKVRGSVAACWHVHGNLFKHIWLIEPDAVIRAGGLVMRGPEDNWQDRNIGSRVAPVRYSDSCRCGNVGRPERVAREAKAGFDFLMGRRD